MLSKSKNSRTILNDPSLYALEIGLKGLTVVTCIMDKTQKAIVLPLMVFIACKKKILHD